jgi:hypothetical protein
MKEGTMADLSTDEEDEMMIGMVRNGDVGEIRETQIIIIVILDIMVQMGGTTNLLHCHMKVGESGVGVGVGARVHVDQEALLIGSVHLSSQGLVSPERGHQEV